MPAYDKPGCVEGKSCLSRTIYPERLSNIQMQKYTELHVGDPVQDGTHFNSSGTRPMNSSSDPMRPLHTYCANNMHTGTDGQSVVALIDSLPRPL